MKKALTLAGWALFTITSGCSHSSLPIPQSPQIRDDRSYLDLQPGMNVRVIVPLLKSGDAGTNLAPQQTDGNTIVLRADNLLGYESATYTVTGKPDRARLQFVSGQQTHDGKTESFSQAPHLPFEFPKHPAHIRLVFLIRASTVDHNMAIVAVRKFDVLNAFTNRLRQDPAVCGNDPEVSCVWVPQGVAVRAEGAASLSR